MCFNKLLDNIVDQKKIVDLGGYIKQFNRK